MRHHDCRFPFPWKYFASQVINRIWIMLLLSTKLSIELKVHVLYLGEKWISSPHILWLENIKAKAILFYGYSKKRQKYPPHHRVDFGITKNSILQFLWQPDMKEFFKAKNFFCLKSSFASRDFRKTTGLQVTQKQFWLDAFFMSSMKVIGFKLAV